MTARRTDRADPGATGSAQPDPAEVATAGLCATCTHVHKVRTGRGSTFYRCGRADAEPAFPRYPRLPVLRCPGHQPE